jgi:hypothetical protein
MMTSPPFENDKLINGKIWMLEPEAMESLSHSGFPLQ